VEDKILEKREPGEGGGGDDKFQLQIDYVAESIPRKARRRDRMGKKT